MNELDKIIKREYETVTEQELMSDGVFPDGAKNILMNGLSHEEYLKVEDEMLKYIIDSESCAFRQGFIRGIAVANGRIS